MRRLPMDRFAPPRWPFELNYHSEQARLLTAWYPVLPWEHDGKLLDLTTNARHITTTSGGPTLVGAELRHAPAMYLDGDDYLVLGTMSTFVTASNAAWSCWVRPMVATYAVTSDGWNLSCIISETNGYCGLSIGNFASGGQKISTYNNNQVVQAVATFEPYRWYHALFGHSGGTLYLYLDGILQGTNASGDTANIGGSLRVNHGWGGFSNIEVADIRVYSTLPSPEAIWQMYDPATRWDLYQRQPSVAFMAWGPVPGGTTYTLTADSAAYTVSGTAASLERSLKLVAASALYAITGTAASLEMGRKLVAESGSYVVTGTDATFDISRRISAESGSVAITGTAASLERSLRLMAESASYAMAGTSASLKVAYRLTAASAAYGVTGTDATLRLGSNTVLVADSGAYVISGTAASLTVAHRLVAESGAVAMTGTAASLKVSRRLTADSGGYAVTGQPAMLTALRRLTGEAGVYVWTGSSAGLVPSRRLPAAAGTYAITGMAATLVAPVRNPITNVRTATVEIAARIERVAEAAAVIHEDILT